MNITEIINQNITSNANNEITAEILRNVLHNMVLDADNKIGDKNTLLTTNKEDLVQAINELAQASNGGLTKLYGTADPNTQNIHSASALDFYVQLQGGSPVAVWVYNGQTWVNLQGSTAVNLTEHNNDPNAHAMLFNQKVDKEVGKGLISNLERQTIQENANKRITNVTITGDVNKILTLQFADGTIVHTNFTDLQGGQVGQDVMLNSLNFSTTTGTLTGVRSDGQQLTTNLNGRFALLGHTHTIAEVQNLEETLNQKAPTIHTHSEYALNTDLADKLDKGNYNGTAQTLKQEIDQKAPLGHTHTLEPLLITQNTILTAAHNNRILMISGNVSLSILGTNGFTGAGIDVITGKAIFVLGTNVTLTGFSPAELNINEKAYIYRMNLTDSNFRLT